jgi:hypothetical protein
LDGLTLQQRRHLKIISGLLDDLIDAHVAGTLVDLGLVVQAGDTYCLTPAGAYIARQY